MKIKIEKPLFKALTAELGKYEIRVGVDDTKPRKKMKEPKELRKYAGVEVYKITSKTDNGKTNVEIAGELDAAFQWLRTPWLGGGENKDVVLVVNDILSNIRGQGDRQRILNAAQAVVRNPILRGDYGKHTDANRPFLMRTGQFFKAILARFVKQQ